MTLSALTVLTVRLCACRSREKGKIVTGEQYNATPALQHRSDGCYCGLDADYWCVCGIVWWMVMIEGIDGVLIDLREVSH